METSGLLAMNWFTREISNQVNSTEYARDAYDVVWGSHVCVTPARDTRARVPAEGLVMSLPGYPILGLPGEKLTHPHTSPVGGTDSAKQL